MSNTVRPAITSRTPSLLPVRITVNLIRIPEKRTKIKIKKKKTNKFYFVKILYHFSKLKSYFILSV